MPGDCRTLQVFGSVPLLADLDAERKVLVGLVAGAALVEEQPRQWSSANSFKTACVCSACNLGNLADKCVRLQHTNQFRVPALQPQKSKVNPHHVHLSWSIFWFHTLVFFSRKSNFTSSMPRHSDRPKLLLRWRARGAAGSRQLTCRASKPMRNSLSRQEKSKLKRIIWFIVSELKSEVIGFKWEHKAKALSF